MTKSQGTSKAVDENNNLTMKQVKPNRVTLYIKPSMRERFNTIISLLTEDELMISGSLENITEDFVSIVNKTFAQRK